MTPITEKSIGIDGRVFADRRAELRRRVLKGATLSFKHGQCTLLGTVRDRSENGARLRFGDICAVPPVFALEISGEKEPLRARICWRTLSEVGVFLERIA